MQTKTITADEHETIRQELKDKRETRGLDLWTIRGNHEDLGRTVLRRKDGVYTVEAEDVSVLDGVGEV